MGTVTMSESTYNWAKMTLKDVIATANQLQAENQRLTSLCTNYREALEDARRWFREAASRNNSGDWPKNEREVFEALGFAQKAVEAALQAEKEGKL